MSPACSFYLRPLLAALVSIGAIGWSDAGCQGQDWSWPQFRGPDGQGHAGVRDLPLHWSESKNVAWKTPLEGRAWSSPVIENGIIWVTTAIVITATKEESEKQQAKRSDRNPIRVASKVDFHAIGVDVNSGKILHNFFLFSKDRPQAIHSLNSYASPTPIIQDKKLYCHFGANGTCCLDTTNGKLVWLNREIQVAHENGPGSTPVLWKNLLIAHMDGIDRQMIAAFNKDTGKVVWQTARSGAMRDNPQYKKAYATPLIVTVDSKPVIISPAADWVYAYEPATGKELWKVTYKDLGFSNVARPVTGHGMVFVCTCFGRGKIMALRLSLNEPEVVWEYNRQTPKMPSPVVLGDELFFVSDSGIVTCLEARTAKPRWVERLGGNYSASPLAAGNRVYFFSREGVATVVAGGGKFEQLAKNTLDGQFMASPAVIPGALILRTDKALYRIETAGSKRGVAP